MQFSRNQIIIIGAGFLVVVGIVLIFVFGLGGRTKPPAVALTIFGVEGWRGGLQGAIDAYKQAYPNAAISYVELREERYEKDLLEAMAAGRGPDILMLKESWLPKHKEKLYPAPPNQFPLSYVRQYFPQAAEQAFVSGTSTYALPLAIDTLALFYNKDLFDAKTIALHPKTWKDFQAAAIALTEFDEGGRISRPGAAIGGSLKSVYRSFDILNLLFLEAGNPKTRSGFNDVRFDEKGFEALDFYLSFAKSQSSSYSWDESLPYSFDMFASGKLPMMFGYASDVALLKEKSPFLNYDIAQAPQTLPGNPISMPGFYGFAVSKQSKVPSWAWDFIIKATTNETLAESLSRSAGQSPALRTLIQKYSTDPALGVFARQALTARMWPMPDEEAVRAIFSNAVTKVLSGRLTSRQALNEAENEINGIR